GRGVDDGLLVVDDHVLLGSVRAPDGAEEAEGAEQPAVADGDPRDAAPLEVPVPEGLFGFLSRVGALGLEEVGLGVRADAPEELAGAVRHALAHAALDQPADRRLTALAHP